jgi:hypothetical protein
VSNQNSQHLSLTNNHYTPVEITQLYSQLIGGQIDLDPFSCEVANSLVNARNYYSKENEENGFLLPWCGSVFCNPPGSFIRLPDYLPAKRGASSMAVAFDKAEAEYLSGNVEQILFVAFSLELLTKREVVEKYPCCFINYKGHSNYPNIITGGGRLKFITEDLISSSSPTHGSFLIYFPCRGQEKLYGQGFAELFSSFGSVVLP